MSWLLTKLFSALFLPPLNFFLLGIAGLAVLKKRPALGKSLLMAMIALLWIFSLPVVGNGLARTLEQGSQLDNTKLRQAQAIVVLGGAGGSFEHVRYGARLYRRSRLPILVTGGDPKHTGLADAERMRNWLVNEFAIPVMWTERKALNTIENAEFSARILKGAKVDTVLLVTHGWHMARAKQLFENSGIHVIPAATGLHYDVGLTVFDFIPTPEGLEDSRLFFHETFGILKNLVFSTETLYERPLQIDAAFIQKRRLMGA